MSAKGAVSKLVQRIESYENDFEVISVYKDEKDNVWRFEVKEVPKEGDK